MSYRSAQGEDRSSYQGVYPWTGFDFGFAKATEGLGWTDPTFAENWHNMFRESVSRGAYHFLHPDEDPVAQAAFFIGFVESHGGIRNGDMLASDCEILAPNVDAANKAFLDECKRLCAKLGVNAILLTYTNENVGRNLHETARAYPELWFAWPSSVAPDSSRIAPFKAWRFWQWGTVAGVDRDAYNGTAAELKAWIASHFKGQPPPPPVNRKIVPVVTDGKTSFSTYLTDHGNKAVNVLMRTFLAGFQWALCKYVAGANFNAPMPAGITIYLAE